VLESVAGWVAPAATMIAAMMTAANLGARITGWGFVVFSIGSVGWILVALASGQQNLLLTNAFLLVVNVVGVWRWLGRQARYEDGGEAAARASARSPVPTLVSAAGLVGSDVVDSRGARLGAVVDAMLNRDRRDLAYLVVSDNAGAGLTETLRALGPDQVAIEDGKVAVRLDKAAFERLPPIAPDRWPEKAPVSAGAPAR
jgi:sporulation protein YlmC with PRC-barrel domain